MSDFYRENTDICFIENNTAIVAIDCGDCLKSDMHVASYQLHQPISACDFLDLVLYGDFESVATCTVASFKG